MATITKKIWPEFFEAVASGKKKYEFRMADDFTAKEGDTIVLEEWDPKTKKYTGRKTEKKIVYVQKFNLDSMGQRKLLEKYGFYILSLE